MANRGFINFYDSLPPRLRNYPLWESVFNAAGRVLDEQVNNQLLDLFSIRDPRTFHRGDMFPLVIGGYKYVGKVNSVVSNEDGTDSIYVQVEQNMGTYRVTTYNNQSREILINIAKMQGINFFSDTLNNRMYVRLAEWVSTLWAYHSNENFVKFIGFIKDIDCHIYQLWSKEVPNQIPAGTGDPNKETATDTYPVLERADDTTLSVIDGGTDYNTSHVEFGYNAVGAVAPNCDLGHLFYLLAPIHLVLERFAAEINGLINEEIVTASSITVTQSGYLHLKD